ncbi:type VI secretion system Vgr family protein [Cronobacter dublinensis]|nr:type VI secretion system Vgr family protein [Cronobacter dublinensis]MDK1193767.1 type VI secretion system Vgr family protein [Cronobacter dublinensis]MDK1200052.1 type VI secretion system Vgr family protein [Cronobacter dublinensis]
MRVFNSGEEHIHLTTEYGKMQLGESKLVDAQDKLRTDEHGMIRVAKGLFILVDDRRMRELKV